MSFVQEVGGGEGDALVPGLWLQGGDAAQAAAGSSQPKEMPSSRTISDFVREKQSSGVLPSSPCPCLPGMLHGVG